MIIDRVKAGADVMRLDFTKMHGTGNDFIFIDDWDSKLDLSSQTVASLCDRHFGIGADGVILVRKSDMEGCRGLMYYINSDGSLAQMCGNGIRCFSKYLCDRGYVEKGTDSFDVETLSGRKTVSVIRDFDGRVSEVKVNMGPPILSPEDIPCTLEPNFMHEAFGHIVVSVPITQADLTYDFTPVSMGNPHAVTFVDNVEDLDLERIGPSFESAPQFPEKTNVEFAFLLGQADGAADIKMRVYERGCGETLACGTGCCATLVAANLNGLCDKYARLHIRGGVLEILWVEDGCVYMTGPATKVYDGAIEVDV